MRGKWKWKIIITNILLFGVKQKLYIDSINTNMNLVPNFEIDVNFNLHLGEIYWTLKTIC